jgi:hypothetical protein
MEAVQVSIWSQGVQRQLSGIRKRKCPKCGVEMQEKRLDQVLADICPECHGMWLDHGELQDLLNARISERANPRDLLHAERTEHSCPDCDRPLFERPFPSSKGVQIDQCVRCGGIFLDAGDLARLREFIDTVRGGRT